MVRTIAVSGTSCNGCEENVETALETIGGVTRAEADREREMVEIETEAELEDETVRAAVEDDGYDVV